MFVETKAAIRCPHRQTSEGSNVVRTPSSLNNAILALIVSILSAPLPSSHQRLNSDDFVRIILPWHFVPSLAHIVSGGQADKHRLTPIDFCTFVSTLESLQARMICVDRRPSNRGLKACTGIYANLLICRCLLIVVYDHVFIRVDLYLSINVSFAQPSIPIRLRCTVQFNIPISPSSLTIISVVAVP